MLLRSFVKKKYSMNKLFVLSVFLFLGLNAQAQSIDKEIVKGLKSDVLIIDVDHSPVEIVTWDKDYIEVESSISIDKNASNDKHSLTISNKKEAVSIKSKVKYDELSRMVMTKGENGEKMIKALNDPKTKSNGFTAGMEFGYAIEGEFKIFVPENLKVDIRATYGSINIHGDYQKLNAHSTYGLVEANLENITDMQDVSLHATYDIVDLTIDENSSANLNLQTTYGEIFTDLPLNSSSNRGTAHSGQCSSGSYILNEGNADVNLIATYSNIYIRKVK